MKYVHIALFGFGIIAPSLLVIYILDEAAVYYLSSLIDRPRMEQHQLWKPSGFFGHGLGIIGSAYAQQSLSLTYSKRIWKLYSYSTVNFTLDETSTSTIYTFVGLSFRF